MSSFTIEIDFNNASYALELDVTDSNGAGVPGKNATVAIRQAGTATLYLDWSNNTFLNGGWVTKNKPMVDLGTGVYQVSLPVAALGFTPLTPLPVELVAEYSLDGGATVGQIDSLTISELRTDAKVSRQYNTNKMDSLAPGTLVRYADDGVTVASTQTLTDATGNPTVDQPNAPQKRGAGPFT